MTPDEYRRRFPGRAHELEGAAGAITPEPFEVERWRLRLPTYLELFVVRLFGLELSATWGRFPGFFLRLWPRRQVQAPGASAAPPNQGRGALGRWARRLLEAPDPERGELKAALRAYLRRDEPC